MSNYYSEIGLIVIFHLLTEQAVDKFLLDGGVIRDLNKFSAKIAEAKKLYSGAEDWIWEAAELLNKGRNRAVHDLIDTDVECPAEAAGYLQNFVDLVRNNLNVEAWVGPALKLNGRFPRAAFAYFAFLADRVKLHEDAKPSLLRGFTGTGETPALDSWQLLFQE
ncbi:hypothetical protein [Burkholderia vietnamiensis]|uniref:hypothetical protein n=1 Tax=Burkholderia vietnamiensis TaxID=60552 RepID=UPI000AA3E487|nr:hypothetical protein [Burkholderia vietnamiensis]